MRPVRYVPGSQFLDIVLGKIYDVVSFERVYGKVRDEVGMLELLHYSVNCLVNSIVTNLSVPY